MAVKIRKQIDRGSKDVVSPEAVRDIWLAAEKAVEHDRWRQYEAGKAEAAELSSDRAPV